LEKKSYMLVQKGQNIKIYVFNREHNLILVWPVELFFNLKLVKVMINSVAGYVMLTFSALALFNPFLELQSSLL